MRKHEFEVSIDKLYKFRDVIVKMKLKKVCEAGNCRFYGGQSVIGAFIKKEGDYIIIEEINDIKEKNQRYYLYYQLIDSIENYDNQEQS